MTAILILAFGSSLVGAAALIAALLLKFMVEDEGDG